MLKDSDPLKALVTEYTRQVVDQVAPEEGDIFDDLIGEYFANPVPPISDPKQSDDELGFGSGEILTAVTPAATAVVSAVLSYVKSEIIKSSQEETASAIKQKIKVLFADFNKTAEVPSKKGKEEITQLTKEQLEVIRTVAVREGRAFGLHKNDAQKMALALIGILATR